jgi:regulator of sigma E protease
MFTTIIIALVSLVGLMVIHELGHFLMALIFKMPVEEFGLGLPPRLASWKIGSVLFSLNLLPFGAFVRIKGEDRNEEGFGLFPAWKQALVLVAGVVANWLTAVVIFGLVAGIWGLPYAVPDEVVNPEARLQVTGVASGSPAESAGLKAGDWLIGMGVGEEMERVSLLQTFTDFIDQHRGEEIFLQLEKPTGIENISLIPRESPPAGEGAIGISFARIVMEESSWWEAPLAGFSATINQTIAIPFSLGQLISQWIKGQPTMGAELVGPIGLGQMIGQTFTLGWNYLLQLVGIIAVYLSLFNILPLPALDGGKILFLGIEKIRRKPISTRIKESLNGAFFVFFILLMLLVTLRDIIHLF